MQTGDGVMSMGSATGRLRAFAEKWCHPDRPPETVDEAELRKSELALGITFPEDYKAEILSVGLPSPTLALLTALTDLEIELFDPSEFHTPQEIIEQATDAEEAGWPDGLVPIAHDSMGNPFCFDATDLKTDTVLSAPIYIWDQDFGSAELVAASFPDWIALYLEDWSAGLKHDDF